MIMNPLETSSLRGRRSDDNSINHLLQNIMESNDFEIVLDGPIRIRSPSLQHAEMITSGHDKMDPLPLSETESGSIGSFVHGAASVSSSSQSIADYFLTKTDSSEKVSSLSVGSTSKFTLKSGDEIQIGQHRLVVSEVSHDTAEDFIPFRWNESEVFEGRILKKRNNGTWEILWKDDHSITKYLDPTKCPPMYADEHLTSGVQIHLGPVSQPLIIPMNTEVKINGSKTYPIYMFI